MNNKKKYVKLLKIDDIVYFITIGEHISLPIHVDDLRELGKEISKQIGD